MTTSKTAKPRKAAPSPAVELPKQEIPMPAKEVDKKPFKGPMTLENDTVCVAGNEVSRGQFAALLKLRDPFEDNLIGYKPRRLISDKEFKELPKSKCKTCGGFHPENKAGSHPVVGHLSYVGHAAVTKRLLDVDPFWFWEPMAIDADGLPKLDASGGLWITLSVAGAERHGYGHSEDMPFSEVGSKMKAIIGDAIRNAAMRFGVALEEWHKGELGLPDPLLLNAVFYGEAGQASATDKPEIKTPVAAVAVAQPDATPVPAPVAADEPLAEEGEVAFILKKISALQSVDHDQFIVDTIGSTTLEGLTKSNFLKLREAVKGKK